MAPGTANPEMPINNPTSQFDQLKEENDKYRDTIGNFLQEEVNIYKKFKSFFTFIIVLSTIVSIISSFILLAALSQEAPFLALISLFSNLVEALVLIWLASLARDFVELRQKKNSAEVEFTSEHRKRIETMSKDIMERAKQRARDMILNVHGGNSIITIDSTVSGGITQKIEAKSDIINALALLVAYARETGNQKAIAAAEDLTAEAGKPSPDKAKIFDLWNTIVSAIPTITSMVEIADGIRKLFI